MGQGWTLPGATCPSAFAATGNRTGRAALAGTEEELHLVVQFFAVRYLPVFHVLNDLNRVRIDHLRVFAENSRFDQHDCFGVGLAVFTTGKQAANTRDTTDYRNTLFAFFNAVFDQAADENRLSVGYDDARSDFCG